MKNSLESSEPEENITNALSGPSENTVSLNPEIENKMEEAPEQQHEGKQDSSLPLDFLLDDIAKLRKLVPPTRDDPNRFPKFIFKMMMSHLENKDSDAGGVDVGTSICEEVMKWILEQSEVDVMDLDEDPQLWPEELYREEREKMRKGLERLASQMGKRADEIWRRRQVKETSSGWASIFLVFFMFLIN